MLLFQLSPTGRKYAKKGQITRFVQPPKIRYGVALPGMCMTLQGINRVDSSKTLAVAVPLELVDWMASRFDYSFPKYLARLDPYADVMVSDDQIPNSISDLRHILEALRRKTVLDVPSRVDLFGSYGVLPAKRTLEQMIEFLQLAIENDWKVISIGD